MKPGTPGFVGERLRAAREARAMTAVALADIVGVTPAAVSQYERGLQSPRPDVMRTLADKLGLPVRYFLRPMPPPTPGVGPVYRSMSAATKTERLRAQRRYEWLKEIVAYLKTLVAFPRVNLPVPDDLPTDPNLMCDEDVEAMAEGLREAWGLGSGPITNCTWLAENNGILVARSELGSETLDSFSEWVGPSPFIFLGAEKASAVRGRLNIGHELGHLVLHRRIAERHVRSIPIDHRRMEEQANRFAGAFLLPAKSFGRDVLAVTLDALLSLKAKWKVSIGAMLKRAEHLGFIGERELERTWINYSRRGWRTREPLDTQLEVESPRLLRGAFELIKEHGGNSEAILAQDFCSARDIESLCGLPVGFLREDEFADKLPEPTVRVLEPGKRSPGERRPVSPGSSRVLPFDRRARHVPS